MWDNKYDGEDYLYGTEPNDFLREQMHRLKKGRVLCLAEGEGRNAVHLARAGFEVTAVDSSAVGLAKAARLAAQHGVVIELLRTDLADYTVAPGSWEAIVSIFCHLPADLRRRVHRDVVAGLCAGGTLLLEAYTPRQLDFGTGGPPSAEFMMELGTLEEELAGLNFLHGAELVREVVEGTGHTGTGAVVQVLAEKR